MKFNSAASKATRPHTLAHFSGASLGTLIRLGILTSAVAAVCLVQVANSPVALEQPEPTVARTEPRVETPAPEPELKPGEKTITVTPGSAMTADEVRSSNWFARARSYVESLEYVVRPGPSDSFEAINPRHGFGVKFDHDTVRFQLNDRERDDAGNMKSVHRWDLNWRTLGVGREDKLAPVYASSIEGEHARVVYDRFGVVEYYDNLPDGVEQSFVIKEPPTGSGQVVLRGQFTSDKLRPEFDEVGKAIYFHVNTEGGGAALRYGNLFAFDARRRVLPAEMKVSGGNVELVVDDTGADYPITIDPLASTNQDWQGSGGAGCTSAPACYGCSMAGGDFNGDGVGDVAVGAPGIDFSATVRDSGALYVYYGVKDPVTGFSDCLTLPATPDFTYQPQLAPNDDFSYFGMNMIAGRVNNDAVDDLVVSAPAHKDSTGFQSWCGQVLVFHGAATTGLSAPNVTIFGQTSTANQYFGMSLALGRFKTTSSPGLDLAVSAHGYSGSPVGHGKVWVFYGDGSGNLPAGDAQVVRGWSARCTDSGTGVLFGVSDTQYPYQGNNAAFMQAHQALAAGDLDGDGDDELVVGSTAGNNAPANLRGALFAYLASPAGLQGGPDLLTAETQANWSFQGTVDWARFGATVACADFNQDGYADIVASAMGATNGQNQEGIVYMFKGALTTGPASLNPASANWRAESDQANAGLSSTGAGARSGFGYSMGVGDTNGDGAPDLLVGAGLYDTGGFNDGGTAFLWYGQIGAGGTINGGVNGNPGNSQWASAGPPNGGGFSQEFGHFVSICKSVDSDTLGDILIGLPRRNGSTGEARLYTTGLHIYFATTTTSVPEGTGGTTSFPFPLASVTCDGTPPNGATVRWRTIEGTALSSSPGLPGTPDFTEVTNGVLNYNGASQNPISSVPANISIVADNVDEALSETFDIELRFPSIGRCGIGAVPFANRRLTVSIQDDDNPPTAILVADTGQTTEINSVSKEESNLIIPQPPAGTDVDITIFVYISVVSGLDAQLQWTTQEITPTPTPPAPYAKAGQDFVADTNIVTIPSGTQEGNFVIKFKADDLDEDNEGFRLYMTNTTSCEISGGTTIPPFPLPTREYPVTIIDDDDPPVACFEFGNYLVTEGNTGQTFFPVTIKLLDPYTGVDRASEKRVEIHYLTAVLGTTLAFQPIAAEDPTMVPQFGISADFVPVDTTAVFDYNGTGGTVLPPNITTVLIFFIVNGDTTYELDEQFEIRIDGPTSTNCQVNPLVGPGVATVTIDDDDNVPGSQPEAQFSTGNTNVNEANTMVTVTITWSAPHERWVEQSPGVITGNMTSVDYQANTGTATGGPGPGQGPNEDYVTINPTTAQLPWLITSVTFQVQIWDDTLNEAAETIDLALTNSVDVAMGVITVATITILDNDGTQVPTIFFNVASVDIAETAGNALIYINLSQASGQAVRITCATSDGTAQAPGDYTTQSLQVTFNPGQTQRSFVVPITDDSIRETNEYIVLTLSSPIAGNLGTPSAMTINILDNEPDPIIEFKRSTYGVSEAGIAATINVKISIQSALPVTIQYSTTAGTATPDFDYTDVAGTLTFPAGSTEQIFTVPILNDTLIEPDETVILQLSNPINATIGSITTATLTIINDENSGNGGGGGVNKGGGGCSGSSSAPFGGLLAVLGLLGVLRLVRRREA